VGQTVTFYSYKGGAGRTMALANIAWILAANGQRVLVVDWDLDSPCLHEYLLPFLDEATITATDGLINQIQAYAWAVTRTDRSPGWLRDHADIMQHAVSINWPDFPGSGTLDFVSAGRQNPDYSSQGTSIDWDNLHDRLGGGQFFDAMRQSMKDNYDYVLIDSPTGVSDPGDTCTLHLADIVVVCFTLNNQSMEKAAVVVANIANRYHSRKIRVLPVLMRVDEAYKDQADAGRAEARARFGSFSAAVTNDEATIEVPYKPFYAYEELLAAFGDAPGSPSSLLAAYERLTAVLTNGSVTALPPMQEEIRLRYRNAFTRR
jgi:MinD-like ATPase involved in chromosome partitioning or flagellar assembly